MDKALEIYETNADRNVAAAGYPLLTRATWELVLHVHALRLLFDGDEPRVARIRPAEANCIRYCCGDASAEGFCQVVQYPDMVLEERQGLWKEDLWNESSNLRKALNIANHLKEDISSGRHDGCEVWQATDNAVWSAVCSKCLSTARHLFYLYVEICQLCFAHMEWLHCFHISGNRMIVTGIDGMSRGDRESGVALGFDLRD